jgi:hypothetical protein
VGVRKISKYFAGVSAQIARVLSVMQGILSRPLAISRMRKEIAVPAFGDRNVWSGYGAILPRPRIKSVKESVVGLGNVSILKSWQPSEESYGAEHFLLEGRRLKMAYETKVFLLVDVA